MNNSVQKAHSLTLTKICEKAADECKLFIFMIALKKAVRQVEKSFSRNVTTGLRDFRSKDQNGQTFLK